MLDLLLFVLDHLIVVVCIIDDVLCYYYNVDVIDLVTCTDILFYLNCVFRFVVGLVTVLC